MAIVQGIREKVHLPIYDSLSVEAEKQLRSVETTSILKFFVNVQGKTKLETNLQSAALLPHYNTFEARAMRVVISDLPPQFPADENNGPLAKTDELEVSAPDGRGFDDKGGAVSPSDSTVTASVETTIDDLAALYKEALDSDDGTAELDVDDDTGTLVGVDDTEIPQDVIDKISDAGGTVVLTTSDLDDMNDSLKAKAIAKEKLDP